MVVARTVKGLKVIAGGTVGQEIVIGIGLKIDILSQFVIARVLDTQSALIKITLCDLNSMIREILRIERKVGKTHFSL